MAPDTADPGHEPTDAELRRLTDDERRRSAVDARRDGHTLRQQAREEGSFRGVLLDLGERDLLVAVATATGRTIRGAIRSVGFDFVGIRSSSGEEALVPIASLTSVQAEPGSRPSVGDRRVALDATLDVTLAGLAPDRPRVSVHTLDGRTVTDHLDAVGRDVLALRAGPAGGTTYVPLHAVGDVTLHG